MRKLIGSAMLVTVLATAPMLASAQRRPAARAAAPRSQQHPSFGVQLDWGSDPNFGIGGRGGVPPPTLLFQTPPPGAGVVFYFFSRHNQEYLGVKRHAGDPFPSPPRASLR